MRPPGAVLAPGESIIATGNRLPQSLYEFRVPNFCFWFEILPFILLGHLSIQVCRASREQ